MSTDVLEENLGIKAGTLIDSGKTSCIVEKLLGEGGFEAVFRVREQNKGSTETALFAIKVERKLEHRRHSKLKMEIAILKAVGAERADRSHFTKIVDRGKKEKFFFLVIELVRKSLADLKATRIDKVFSLSTGLSVGVQLLEAVEDLHKFGYIHRDLKPIYILDFGIARRILNEKSELKTPRAQVAFRGTVKFAPSPFIAVVSLVGGTIARVGSIWSPMEEASEKGEVLESKVASRTIPRRDALFHGLNIHCNERLGRIMDYVDTLHYYDHVDYVFIYGTVKEAARLGGVSLEELYDCEENSSISSFFVLVA